MIRPGTSWIHFFKYILSFFWGNFIFYLRKTQGLAVQRMTHLEWANGSAGPKPIRIQRRTNQFVLDRTPSGRARTGCLPAAWAGPHVGWSDDLKPLRVRYRAVQLGRASPAHSSLKKSGSSALFFLFLPSKNAWFIFSVSLFFWLWDH